MSTALVRVSVKVPLRLSQVHAGHRHAAFAAGRRLVLRAVPDGALPGRDAAHPRHQQARHRAGRTGGARVLVGHLASEDAVQGGPLSAEVSGEETCVNTPPLLSYQWRGGRPGLFGAVPYFCRQMARRTGVAAPPLNIQAVLATPRRVFPPENSHGSL